MDNKRAMREIVRPQMLSMGRILRAKTQKEVALETGIDQALISKYENGHPVPVEDLNKIAQVLELPEVFFRRQIEIHSPNGASMMMFRRRKTALEKQKNQVLMEINRVRDHISVLLESVEVESIARIPLYEPKTESFDEIEDIAERTRLELRVPPGPVQSMTRVLESVGVVIIRRQIPGKIDALVDSVLGGPVILLIADDLLGGRQRFTLGHELGHLVMHNAINFSEEILERQGDRFSSAFLMPERDIKPKLRHLTMERIVALSAEWRVSIQAIVHRARDLDVITERQARSWYEEFSRRGYRNTEPVTIPVENPTLIGSLINLHMNELKYTVSELSYALAMLEWEFASHYLAENKMRIVPKVVKKHILRPYADGS